MIELDGNDEKFTVIHEYAAGQLPVDKLVALIQEGTRVYKICQNGTCMDHEKYCLIRSVNEPLESCLSCGQPVARYGVESR